MGKEIITFSNTEIEKQKFHHHKNPIFLKNIEIGNILISNKTSDVKKNYNNFIVYLDADYKMKPLHIMLLKTSVYIKSYDSETK